MEKKLLTDNCGRTKEPQNTQNRKNGISLSKKLRPRQVREDYLLQKMLQICSGISSRTESRPRLRRFDEMAIVVSFSTMRTICLWWQCTGSTDSIIWLAGTMIFIECRCQTLHRMYAATPIARTKPKPG